MEKTNCEIKDGQRFYIGNESMIQDSPPSQPSEEMAGNKTCLNWSDLTNKPWYMGVGDHNYCRNPGKEARQDWCFHRDKRGHIRKGYCAVETCGKTLDHS